MNKWFETLILSIFPRRCACCGKTIDSSRLICARCEKELPRIDGVICRKCARGKNECMCKGSGNYYDSVAAPFYYEGCIRHGVHIFKFRNGFRNYEAYSLEMSETVKERLGDINFDFITEVPMTRKSRKKRGYNQCFYLAKGISEHLGIEHKADVLSKIYNTKIQHEIKYYLRKGNLTGVFDVTNPSDVEGKTILLCDDILTSGETLNECAKMLWLYGAKEIHCITLAVTKRKMKTNKE
ncbi:MAG: ComF family protein [Clostridia bacterium]|nr:ComF family protein [Clostridia bacterium]